MKRIVPLALFGAAIVLAAPAAYAISVPYKAKAKSIQGTLVPAFKPTDTGSGTGDDENEGANAALQDPASARSACTFEQGQYKVQVGKDASVKLTGVSCGGVPYTGNLCAHAKALATILNEDIDKTGASTPKTCISGIAGDIAGQTNWVSANIGTVVCAAGKCKGTMPQVTSDPCPDVDKVSEYRRIEIFDGPGSGSLSIGGSTLSACCGAGQTMAGSINVNGVGGCPAVPTQDVMGSGGTILQGVAP